MLSNMNMSVELPMLEAPGKSTCDELQCSREAIALGDDASEDSVEACLRLHEEYQMHCQQLLNTLRKSQITRVINHKNLMFQLHLILVDWLSCSHLLEASGTGAAHWARQSCHVSVLQEVGQCFILGKSDSLLPLQVEADALSDHFGNATPQPNRHRYESDLRQARHDGRALACMHCHADQVVIQ